ncbi:MAG TPA: TolC family protein [Gemmatimonadales bacterium]|nr:TolC family protein [Gemmatimonadales bacterium]
MTRRWLLMSGVVLSFLPLPPLCAQSAQDSAGILHVTRREAVDIALAQNPQVRVAVEQLAQARARGVENTALPDPSFSTDITPSNESPGSDIGLSLTMPFPTKFLLRHRQSAADIHAAEFNVVQVQQQIASQTAQAYDALLVALRHRADLAQADSLARDFLDKTQVRFAAGSVAHLDVIKAQVALAQIETNLLTNARDVANARAVLNRFVNRPLGGPIEPGDTLGVPAPLPALETLEAAAESLRPELRGLASARSSAGSAAALAQQYFLPDVALGWAKNLQQGAPVSYTTSVGFSVPIFFWNHQRGDVAEARHHERELDATYADLEAQVAQDVRTSYSTAATAQEQVVYLRDALVPEARQAFDIAFVSYGLGGSSALDVLDARRDLLDAESQYADALAAANDARADLERAVGAPLPVADAR